MKTRMERTLFRLNRDIKRFKEDLLSPETNIILYHGFSKNRRILLVDIPINDIIKINDNEPDDINFVININATIVNEIIVGYKGTISNPQIHFFSIHKGNEILLERRITKELKPNTPFDITYVLELNMLEISGPNDKNKLSASVLNRLKNTGDRRTYES